MLARERMTLEKFWRQIRNLRSRISKMGYHLEKSETPRNRPLMFGKQGILNGTQKLLCGNVTKFLIAKNGCAHRVQRTGISLGLIFHVSGSLIFQDFWDWKLKSRVLCTARYVHSVSANLKILFLFESSSQSLHLVVFSESPDTRIDRKWRHLEFFDFRIIR